MTAPAGQGAAATVRRHDPDRFLVSLFLPAAARADIWTLLLFNHELARTIETGARRGGEAGHMPALVRLQWWREVIEGAERRHEVAEPLGALIARGRLDPAALETMIAAREAELEGLADLASWEANLRAGAGTLATLMGRLAGQTEAALARAGAAYGAGASLRNRAALLAVGRTPFPLDEPDPAALARHALAAFLPAGPPGGVGLLAVLARRDLRRVARGRGDHGPRGIGDRLAVLAAGLRGGR